MNHIPANTFCINPTINHHGSETVKAFVVITYTASYGMSKYRVFKEESFAVIDHRIL